VPPVPAGDAAFARALLRAARLLRAEAAPGTSEGGRAKGLAEELGRLVIDPARPDSAAEGIAEICRAHCSPPPSATDVASESGAASTPLERLLGELHGLADGADAPSLREAAAELTDLLPEAGRASMRDGNAYISVSLPIAFKGEHDAWAHLHVGRGPADHTRSNGRAWTFGLDVDLLAAGRARASGLMLADSLSVSLTFDDNSVATAAAAGVDRLEQALRETGLREVRVSCGRSSGENPEEGGSDATALNIIA